MPSKGRMDLRTGDILTLYTAGGAGYGPPAEREKSLIEDDVRQGILTAAAARKHYGIKA